MHFHYKISPRSDELPVLRISVYILYNTLIALITKSCTDDHMATPPHYTHTHIHTINCMHPADKKYAA